MTQRNFAASVGIKTTCKSCHSDVATAIAKSGMSHYGVECIDCHTPYAILSSPGQQLGPFECDIRIHMFKIKMSAAFLDYN